MKAAFDPAGVCHAERLYEGVGHIQIVADFAWLYNDSSPVVADMVEFFDGLQTGAICGEEQS